MADNDEQPQAQEGDGKVTKIELTDEQNEFVNRIVAKRTDEAARKAAEAERDRINAYLEAQKAEADRAEMDELDRLRAEQADAVKRAEAAEKAATLATKQAAATTALVAAQVNPDRLSDVLKLVDLTVDDLDAEVTALAERLPELFQTGQDTPPPPRNPGLNPGGHEQRQQANGSAADRARARFEQKYPRPA